MTSTSVFVVQIKNSDNGFSIRPSYPNPEFLFVGSDSSCHSARSDFVGTYCTYLDDELTKGVCEMHVDNSARTIQSFLRILSEEKMSLGIFEIMDIWKLAVHCGYRKANMLRDIIVSNVMQFDIDSQIELFGNANIDQSILVSKMSSIKQMREVSKKISDVDTLRLIVEQLIKQRNADIKIFKDDNEKLRAKIADLEGKLAKHEQKPKQEIPGMGDLSAMGSLFDKFSKYK